MRLDSRIAPSPHLPLLMVVENGSRPPSKIRSSPPATSWRPCYEFAGLGTGGRLGTGGAPPRPRHPAMSSPRSSCSGNMRSDHREACGFDVSPDGGGHAGRRGVGVKTACHSTEGRSGLIPLAFGHGPPRSLVGCGRGAAGIAQLGVGNSHIEVPVTLGPGLARDGRSLWSSPAANFGARFRWVIRPNARRQCRDDRWRWPADTELTAKVTVVVSGPSPLAPCATKLGPSPDQSSQVDPTSEMDGIQGGAPEGGSALNLHCRGLDRPSRSRANPTPPPPTHIARVCLPSLEQDPPQPALDAARITRLGMVRGEDSDCLRLLGADGSHGGARQKGTATQFGERDNQFLRCSTI